jgi:hypothetical protein
LAEVEPNDDDDDDGAIWGMNDWQGNWSTQRKAAPVLFWPPKTPHMT